MNRLTLAFSLVIIAAIIGFDVWTLLARGYETTISWNLYMLAQKQPIVSFSIGVVSGHLFWPNRAAA